MAVGPEPCVPPRTRVLVVGGGLSGLHTACALRRRGIDVLVAEARDRLGGRILSQAAPGALSPAFDLGPSWFWPHQARMRALLTELNLTAEIFAQASEGEALWEDARGVIHRGVQGISMQGSYRIKGGMQGVVAGLRERCADDAVLCRTRVTHVRRRAESVVSTLVRDGELYEVASDVVVFAMPPRLVVASIAFAPELAPARVSELQSIATWMAAQAKVVVLYREPLWRTAGLSGDVFSHRGPLREIHDTSPDEGGPYALFGFVGVPAAQRAVDLRPSVIEQLTRLFGAAAASPLEVLVKDWARDPFTATAADQEMPSGHPSHRIAETAEAAWDARLLWSGSETASTEQQNNGYLEGALEASERTVAAIVERA